MASAQGHAPGAGPQPRLSSRGWGEHEARDRGAGRSRPSIQKAAATLTASTPTATRMTTESTAFHAPGSAGRCLSARGAALAGGGVGVASGAGGPPAASPGEAEVAGGSGDFALGHALVGARFELGERVGGEVVEGEAGAADSRAWPAFQATSAGRALAVEVGAAGGAAVHHGEDVALAGVAGGDGRRVVVDAEVGAGASPRM